VCKTIEKLNYLLTFLVTKAGFVTFIIFSGGSSSPSSTISSDKSFPLKLPEPPELLKLALHNRKIN
jgi:hypothetical protein